MQAQKFITNYKCDCYGQNYCNCPQKLESNEIFLENIYDIADSLAEVMVICGIHQCKAKAAIDVIIYSFLHYDEIRHRIDAVPRKRLCKEDLIHDLGRKCLMNRMEAQLTYSIIKRAFKAFYHGTSEGGVRNPILEAQLVHTQECLWVHASKRTAQIFASYEGMFFTAQKNYETLIRCVYKRLYDRLLKRADPVEVDECSCKDCLKRIVVGGLKQHKGMLGIPTLGGTGLAQKSSEVLPKPCEGICADYSSTDLLEQEVAKVADKDHENGSKTSLNLRQCHKCNCPQLICDCNVDQNTGVVSAECSQGPYKCQWVRVDEEEPADSCIEIPEDHQCPVDCDETSAICDPECECNCESCECAAESSDYEDDNEVFAISEGSDKGEEEYGDTDSIHYPTYGGCGVPINHIVEEVRITENPASIAEIENHRIETSLRSEQVQHVTPTTTAASQDGAASSPKVTKQNLPTMTATNLDLKSSPLTPTNGATIKNPNQPTDLRTDEEKHKEAEEVSKLIGQLI